MADEHNRHDNLPTVLVLGSPTCFSALEKNYSHKFNFLVNNSWSSPISLQDFLISNRYETSSIRALLCSASYPITAEVLRLLHSLGIVITTSAGTDHIDLAECCRRGIRVADAGDLFTEDVADTAVGLLIDVTRKISAGDRYVRNQSRCGPWDFPLGSKVEGKRVGIVGLGRIGTEVAKRLEALGYILSYHSRNKKPLVSYNFYSNVVQLAADSNALVVCCALNNQTKHIINKQVMLALGKKGIIVNVARGSLIVEKELVECLIEGEIGGAGLDVFENEPNIPKEFFELDNVVLSPHCAAFTLESIIGLCELVVGNLDAFFSNNPLITPVRGIES